MRVMLERCPERIFRDKGKAEMSLGAVDDSVLDIESKASEPVKSHHPLCDITSLAGKQCESMGKHLHRESPTQQR